MLLRIDLEVVKLNTILHGLFVVHRAILIRTESVGNVGTENW